MTNEKKQAEQDLEISDDAAEAVTGGVGKVVRERVILGEAAAEQGPGEL